MLTSSFCVFDGLSASAERRLWRSGCLSWRALERLETPYLSPRKLNLVRAQISEATEALDVGRASYFLDRLEPPDDLRVLPHFSSSTGYLDIETTGLSESDEVTTVALYLGGRARCFVRDLNLDQFPEALVEVAVLITFNGESFDLPRLRQTFGLELSVPHIDLRRSLAELGYRGGLKSCEKALKIPIQLAERGDGATAVKLWQHYEASGDRSALLKLLRYNLQDTLSLEHLAAKGYHLVMSSFPLPLHCPPPPQPQLPNLRLDSVL